ncbi:MAG: twin-arginine translocase subunit TatC [Bacteroidetes bacterium]|nr:twin-arginine translocase subunit TatC [Bacteroidota bacterium]
MSFIDHIEELRWHIIRSMIAILVASIVVFIYAEWIYEHIITGPIHTDFISYRWLCQFGHFMGVQSLCLDEINLTLQNTEVSGQFLLSFSSSFTMGFIAAFPYVFWEFWKFLKPALKPAELKHARGIVLWSSILFFFGVVFGYLILVPFTINFFANYQLSPDIKNIFTIKNYYQSVSDMVLGMGIVFELPVVVFFLSRVGILTPKLMRNYRRYAIVILIFLSQIITPPDWFSWLIVFVPVYLLYEGSIRISARAERDRMQRQKELMTL